MIQANLASSTFMTKLFIGDFLQRKKRSGVINVSSGAAYSPISYQGCYSATKVFMRFMSYMLEHFYKSKVDVQNLTQGL